ncbi:hypothetical protein [Pseudarthrobacter sp. WHRI 8279]|uniref:hypothetical protein n=1 Tax=Pseudarthrobacter sp. WHRI 8279 TaxID=3162566 RepID=UPI0032EC2BB2
MQLGERVNQGASSGISCAAPITLVGVAVVAFAAAAAKRSSAGPRPEAEVPADRKDALQV